MLGVFWPGRWALPVVTSAWSHPTVGPATEEVTAGAAVAAPETPAAPAGTGAGGAAGVAGTGVAGRRRTAGRGGGAAGSTRRLGGYGAGRRGRYGRAGAGGGGRGGGAAGSAAGAAGTGAGGAAGRAAGAGGGGRGGAAPEARPAGRRVRERPARRVRERRARAAGGGAGCRRELLTNGDFELAMSLVERGAAGHTAGAQVRRRGGREPPDHAAIRSLRPPTRRSQHQLLVHYVEQYANIPSGALEITISGYLQIRTEEPADDIYDEAYVQLFDEATPASPLFRSAPRWSNLTQANGWTPFSFPVNVASVAGKQLVFRVLADLDTSVPTYFYFDTLSVAVTRCSP